MSARDLQLILVSATLAACNSGPNARSVFEFSALPTTPTAMSQKDAATASSSLNVQVSIDLLGPADADMVLDLTGASYLVTASIQSGTVFTPVPLVAQGSSALTGSGSAGVPVTLTSATASIDATAQIPASISAGSDGYALTFALQPASTALSLDANGDTDTLRAFKAGLRSDAPIAANAVTLSLSSTLAATVMDSLAIPYTQESFDNVVAAVQPVLDSASSQLDASAKPPVSSYVAGMIAMSKMLLASDTATQASLVPIVASTAGSTDAVSTAKTAGFMGKITTAMSSLATASAAVFATSTGQTPVTIFSAGVQSQLSASAKSPTSQTVYTAKSIKFTDTDPSRAIGGTVVITAQSSKYPPAAYHVYLGGPTSAASKLVLLGTATAAGPSWTLAVPNGTAVPARANSFWVFPLASDGTEINSPKSAGLTNDISSAPPSRPAATPSQVSGPTVGGAIAVSSTQSTSVALTWPAASDPSTAQGDLQYKVVDATSSSAISTISAADAVTGAEVIVDWTPGLTSTTVSGLEPASSYAFAVLVKDGSGGEALYSPVAAVTAAAAAFNPSDPSADVSVRDVIAVGDRHSCFITPSNDLECVGLNSSGQLGDGTTANRSTPVLALSNVIKAAAGYSHTCAVLADGTVACWGGNSSGQIGDGTTAARTSPVPISGLTAIKQLALGADFSCALTNGGQVSCWGANAYGQLGDGTNASHNTPALVPGLTNVTSIDAQNEHICAALADRTARCWGLNAAGQLGNGNANNSNVPVDPGLTDVLSISAGNHHTCAVLVGGTAKCWGDNQWGQLGAGVTGGNQEAPVDATQVAGGISFVSAHGDRSCFALAAGGIQCMGFGGQGQLGQGVSANSATAVAVQGVSQVAFGMKAHQDHTCFQAVGGTFECWGYNAYDELGDGTSTTRNAPVTVQGL